MTSCMYNSRAFLASPASSNHSGDGVYPTDHTQLDFLKSGSAPLKKKKGEKKNSAPTCKYVPHKDKPPQLVQRRNARERRRVQSVNSAFLRLRRMVPHENKHKRLSKVKTLRFAINYIRQLQELIDGHDSKFQETISRSSEGCQSPESQHHSPPHPCGIAQQMHQHPRLQMPMGQESEHVGAATVRVQADVQQWSVYDRITLQQQMGSSPGTSYWSGEPYPAHNGMSGHHHPTNNFNSVHHQHVPVYM